MRTTPSTPAWAVLETGVTHEQALVCLSNREIVDASRWCTFHCKMAKNCLITVVFSNWFGLIYLAIQPPSIITAFVHPPSTLAVEFCYSETRACSFPTCAPDANSANSSSPSPSPPIRSRARRSSRRRRSAAGISAKACTAV